MALLEMKQITKIYPNVIANDQVDFSVNKGEIHALMGENGAGKSTLMKILFGLEKPDKGEIYLNDEMIKLNSPLDALKHGIGMVHQHFMLAEELTVAENIILGEEPGKFGFIDKSTARARVKAEAEKYNFNIHPDDKVEDLAISAKQKVEILKVLVRGTKILILDEPTAVLTPQETDELFEQLMKLKEEGYTIIFISHKLDEIKKICSRITIMRQGKISGVFDLKEISAEDISRLMIGRVVRSSDLKKPDVTIGKAALSVDDLSVFAPNGKPLLNQIRFNLREGEILGIAGVEGNGQSELVNTITGLNDQFEGDISLDGKSIKGLKIKNIRNRGLSHIPEDRMVYGASQKASISDNIIATIFDRPDLSGNIFLKQKPIEALSHQLIDDFAIKASSPKENIGNLSGGNVQKVVVAREIHFLPRVLIANQPTRGIDVGAAMFIRQKILDLKKEKAATLLLSADMSELFSLSDRIIVMYGGEITAFFEDVSVLDEQTLGWYMLGVKKMEQSDMERRMGL